MSQPLPIIGNLTALTEYNRARVVRALYRRGVCSRADIARETGLTPTAITKITGDLIALGAITEVGDMPGRAGRRSIGIALNGTGLRVIGVTFERSSITAGVFTLEGNPLDEPDSRAELSIGAGEHAKDVVARAQDWIRERLEADRAIVAVGITIPGPYLPQDGRIAVVTQTNDWESVNFRESFVDAFAVPVTLAHDAGAGALAQQLLNPHCRMADSLAYLLLGEGTGLGVIDHGQLLVGAHGGAGEIGHISIDVNGPACKCGNRGCLERYCSAEAVRERLIARTPLLVEDAERLSPIAACRALFALAAAGDADALEHVRELGRYVGYGCVTVINAYDPEIIVLGDLMAEAGEPLLAAAQAVVDERVAPALRARVRLSLNTMGGDEVLSGAVALAIEHALGNPTAMLPR